MNFVEVEYVIVNVVHLSKNYAYCLIDIYSCVRVKIKISNKLKETMISFFVACISSYMYVCLFITIYIYLFQSVIFIFK
jgi:hypothetical protein